jgi:hypothetical protein
MEAAISEIQMTTQEDVKRWIQEAHDDDVGAQHLIKLCMDRSLQPPTQDVLQYMGLSSDFGWGNNWKT